MSYELVSLRSDAIDRPPHWRWLRASRCVTENRPTDRRRDDLWVSSLIRFIRQLGQANTPELVDALADSNPVLYWTHRMATASGEAASRLRTQVEARLLCHDFDPGAVAVKTGMTAAQVEAYRNVFFDVRDRLENVGWVTSHVLGPSSIDGFNPRGNSHLTLKMCGWIYGSLAVDLLAGRGFDGRPPGSIDGINVRIDAAEGFESRIRSYLATRALTIDQFTAPIVFQHAADLRRRNDDQEKVRRETGAADGDVAPLKAMLDSLSAVFGRQAVGGKPRTDMGAVEPRAATLFALANGTTTDDPPSPAIPEVFSHDR